MYRSSYVYIIIISYLSSDFANEEVGNHLSSGDAGSPVESGEVEGGRKGISEAEGQHGGNPSCNQVFREIFFISWDLEHTSSILESEATLVHFVLLNMSSGKVVDGTGRVSFNLQTARSECPLLSNEDVKVVVGGVQTAVAFRTERGAENDQVLGDTSMDDVHGTHSTTGIVEHPFVHISVDTNLRRGIGLRKIPDDVVDHSSSVVGVGLNGRLRQFVQGFGLKDIPPILGENEPFDVTRRTLKLALMVSRYRHTATMTPSTVKRVIQRMMQLEACDEESFGVGDEFLEAMARGMMVERRQERSDDYIGLYCIFLVRLCSFLTRSRDPRD